MQRRSWLALGAVSAAVLAIGGGSLAMLTPGVDSSRLSSPAREVFRGAARALLDGSLPSAEPARGNALAALVDRVEALIAALPPHAQSELSQLLAILSSGAGRRALAGLATTWAEAPVAELQAALQAMRVSSVSLRQQAYQALHDIVGAAYFADAGTWSLMGYPGPLKV